MRAAFTIVFNGAHHLLHADFAERMCSMFQKWAIVQGAAMPGGSTSWCREPDGHHFGDSTDDTIRILAEIKTEYPDIVEVINPKGGPWQSKDEMVNAAVDRIREHMGNGGLKKSFKIPGVGSASITTPGSEIFLWQVDVDEVWGSTQLFQAERELMAMDGNCGCFHAHYYVGHDLVAKGCWGEGNDPSNPRANAYRRLWRWNGHGFASHEPPALEGGNGREVLLSQKFRHYAYWNRKDVAFKERYYTGHEGILDRWDALQALPPEKFPRPISDLITGHWGQTNTKIYLA